MDLSRIITLRESLETEDIDLEELSEIEQAFAEIPDGELSDVRENAMAADMLNELEARVSPIEWKIYDWIFQNFGENEANNPCYAFGDLARVINEIPISFGAEDRNIGDILAEQ